MYLFLINFFTSPSPPPFMGAPVVATKGPMLGFTFTVTGKNFAQTSGSCSTPLVIRLLGLGKISGEIIYRKLIRQAEEKHVITNENSWTDELFMAEAHAGMVWPA